MPLVYRQTKHGLEYRSEAPHLVAKRVAEGWSTSKAAAVAPELVVAAAPATAPAAPALDASVGIPDADDDSPPTRKELEAKATELGIKVDKRWSDKTLSERVDDVLKG